MKEDEVDPCRLLQTADKERLSRLEFRGEIATVI
jgi:hypothetical protein